MEQTKGEFLTQKGNNNNIITKGELPKSLPRFLQVIDYFLTFEKFNYPMSHKKNYPLSLCSRLKIRRNLSDLLITMDCTVL